MIQQLIDEKNKFIKFSINNKFLYFIIVLATMLSYGIKLVGLNISIDTEAIIDDFDVQMKAWNSIDRFGLVAFKKLFSLHSFNPFVANFLTIFFLFFTCIFICYLVNKISRNKIKSPTIVILPLLFLTHPIFAEQFNFKLQSFEVALSMFLIVCSMILINMYIEYKTPLFLFLSIIFSSWSFLTYQSLIIFYISLSITIVILLLNFDKNLNLLDYLKVISLFLLVFICSMIITQSLVFIGHQMFSIKSTDYLNSKITWGKLPFIEIFSILKSHFKNILLAKGIFYNLGFDISILSCFFIFIKKIILKSRFIAFEILCVLLLNVSPFMLTIFMGNVEPIRSQMPSMQFVIAFNFLYVAINLTTKSFLVIFISLALVISFRQGVTTANLFYSERAKYEEDVIFANRINIQLDSLNVSERKNYSLVLIGEKTVNSNLVIQGETLGHSFFAWDIGGPYGTSSRAVGFMRTLGYDFKYPSNEEYKKGLLLKEKMSAFPKKNSILINDNTIFIKLSD